jgi:glycosyltransferase involved in cell wall biosynthesis
MWNLPLLRHYYHQKVLVSVSKKEDFDIIQSRTIPPYIESAYKLSKKLNKPLLVEAHPVEDANINSLYLFYIFKKLNILKRASHIITLTNSLKEWIHDQYKITEEKITVINNCVDSETFKPKKSDFTKTLREKLGNPKKIVFYAGFLDDINGINLLIKIMPQIIEENPQISFIFMGHGPYYNTLLKLSKEHDQIKLIPSSKHELMPFYYQISDIFIIPRPSLLSTELITPLKLLEAMSMESVVLASDVGGIKEVIENGKNGYLYDKTNPDSLKNNLLMALENDNHKIKKNARKTILNEYTWDRSAEKLKTVYENMSHD